MVSTFRGEMPSDSSSDPSTSDNDTDDSAPPPNQTTLGKRKHTQARAEARRRKLSLQTRDTEPDDDDNGSKLVDPCTKWESSSNSNAWFTPVTDKAHFGYVNDSNQINYPIGSLV